MILLTGSEGFIGNQLKKHIPNFIGLDIKDSADIQHDIATEFPYAKKSPFRCPINSVVHLAALTGIEQCNRFKILAYNTNVEGTRNVIDFVRKNNVEKLVFASSAAIYKNQSYYATLKLKNEFEILMASRKYGFTASILRFGNVYGLGFPYKEKLTVIHKFILQALLNEELTIYGDGKQTRDFINIKDVCHAIQYCLNNKVQGVYYVGTQKQTSINELVNLIKKQMEKIFNRKICKVYETDMKREKPEEIDVPKEHFRWNWKPQITLEQGIKEILTKMM